jgi:putative thioredoxin
MADNKEVYVFEVSETSFAETVLGNSSRIPVIVEFMGFWSEPCITQSEILTGLAHEFASQFIFARVDIDENPGLRQRYDIQNVPTTKVFLDQNVTQSEEGQLTEEECRQLLRSVDVYHVSDDMRMQARELHLAGDTRAAFIKLTEAIKQDPQNTRVAMDMVQIFIDTHSIDNANALFNKLPASVRESRQGKLLSRQLMLVNYAAQTRGREALKQRIQDDETDLDARFDYAICLIVDHETVEGIDQLFYIIEKNIDFRDGAAREMVMSMASSLKENEPGLAKSIQQRLSNLTHG